MGVVTVLVCLLRALLSGRAAIAAENLALRQQLAVLQLSVIAIPQIGGLHHRYTRAA